MANVTIKKERARIFPRDSIGYFSDNEEKWEALKAGASVAVPIEVYHQIPEGIVSVVEVAPQPKTVVRPRASSSKSKAEKKKAATASRPFSSDV